MFQHVKANDKCHHLWDNYTYPFSYHYHRAFSRRSSRQHLLHYKTFGRDWALVQDIHDICDVCVGEHLEGVHQGHRRLQMEGVYLPRQIQTHRGRHRLCPEELRLQDFVARFWLVLLVLLSMLHLPCLVHLH
ncbi:hypothetical protein CAOG_009891 [Capsaspora owczarzaki ATCC 30864]|uniref:Uncharacterized protein n=1 Tax=Capsaspora owczarzaki (strain ATCC 30864) TaxID=595528 RepID=A0A0D2VUZ4_CAPO3|nr:hypothetical protein CAOG_009891 [Capsaspora owczarzaki ATCC 30864]